MAVSPSHLDIEQDIVAFANVLVVLVDSEWRTVDLFDCTHGDRNDHHRYDRDGYKHSAVVVHHGTPAEAATSPMVVVIDEHGDEQWLPGTGRFEDWEWPEY